MFPVLDRSARGGQEAVGHVPVDHQGLGGVADAGPLGLAVDDDGERHVELRGPIDIHVTITVPVDHVGHGGVLDDGFDQ